MQTRTTHVLARAAALAASAVFTASATAYDTYTVTFQQGANGYSSQIERTFGTNSTKRGGDLAGNPSLNTMTGVWTGGTVGVDGWDAPSNGADSPDKQIFLKFDNIIGSGSGQIPSNAFVLGASLTLTTGNGSSDNSGGPLGVGAVLVNWNTSTSATTGSIYSNLKPAGSPTNGLSSDYNAISRAVGFYDDPKLGGGGNKNNSLDLNEVATANVDSVVRNWVNGTVPNYGFTIHAGAPAATADAWGVGASNNHFVENRPKLSVTYTNAPVQTATFQQGVNGYNGTSMVWLRDSNVTTDGSSMSSPAFLDGWGTGDTEDDVSADDHALIKFNNIFTSQGGSVPDHAVIVKAYVKVTTSNVSNAQTGQSYEVHQMLANWNSGTKYTDFGGYGPLPGGAETTDYSYNYGMIPNSEAYFDITQAVASWQSGQANYGVDLRAALDPNDIVDNTNGTSDGWSIYFTGAANTAVRPQLLVSYFLHLPGDANDDGKINGDDFALTDRGFRKQLTGWSNGDFNYDGIVDSADYLILDGALKSQGGLSPDFLAAREAQFGEAYVEALLASVPEPSCLALAGVAAAFVGGRRRRS